MSNSQNYKNIRWHDNRGDLSALIKTLVQLPDSLVDLFAGSIQNRAERTLGEKYLKSLGAQKVLGLYQAKKKQREYDQNATLHRTVNYFYVLPKSEQDYLATESVMFVRTMVIFIEGCQKRNIKVDLRRISSMCDTFKTQGNAQVQRYIDLHYPELQFEEELVFGAEQQEFSIQFQKI